MNLKKICWADFETSTAVHHKTQSRVYVWGLKTSFKGDMHWDIDISSFFDKLKELKIKTCYFHNLNFDGWFIWTWLLDNNFTYADEVKPDELEENTFNFIMTSHLSIFKINLNYKGHNVEFRCTLKVLQNSVFNLGETLSKEFPEFNELLHKKSIDYDAYYKFKSKKEVPLDLIAYLENDINIVIKSIYEYEKFYKNGLTISSVCQKTFIKMYGARNFANDFGGRVYNYRAKTFEIQNIISEKEWNFFKKGARGGYTTGHPDIKNILLNNVDGYSTDIVSSYPHKCLFDLPYGRIYYSKPKQGNFATYSLYFIISAKPKSWYKGPPLWRVKEDLIKKEETIDYKYKIYKHNVENEDYYFWEEEFEFFKKAYDIDYIITTSTFVKLKPHSKIFIETLKHNKINAKSKTERNTHKLFLNCYTGKYGQMIYLESKIPKKDEDNSKTRYKHYGKNKEWYLETKVTKSDYHSYMPLYSYITMKGRLHLYEMIFENHSSFLYCDTDSVYLSDKIKIPKNHKTGLDFGDWEHESRFNRFRFIKPKCYAYDKTHTYNTKTNKYDKIKKEMVIKAAGVTPEGIDYLNWDNFKKGTVLIGKKSSGRRLDTGIMIMEGDVTL